MDDICVSLAFINLLCNSLNNIRNVVSLKCYLAFIKLNEIKYPILLVLQVTTTYLLTFHTYETQSGKWTWWI